MTKPLLAVAAAVVLAPLTAQAQVTQWRIVKGPAYQQTLDNTPATSASSWSVGVYLDTFDPADATSVTVAGGGIAGSLPLVLEDGEWALELDYASKAAMDAQFPSSSAYTITVSGGTLGTLVQPLIYSTEAYPNIPFLTGTGLTDSLSVAPQSPFVLGWSNPGPFTQTNGVTILEVYDLVTDDSAFFDFTVGVSTGTVIPGCTLDSSTSYDGFLEFTHAIIAPGAGGFGIDGLTAHNTALDFVLTSIAGPTSMEVVRLGTPPNPNALLPGQTSGPVIGQVWDPVIDHSSFAPAAAIDLVFIDFGGPINVPLGGSLGTLLCSVPAGPLIFTGAPGAAFGVAFPDECVLVGLPACSQGASVGLAGIELTNALDLVIGMP